MPRFITIPGFKGGYTNDLFDLNGQTYQAAQDLDVITNSQSLTPHLALGADLTDKTRNNIKLDSVIKASDGRIYFKGFDNSAGTTLTLWDAGASLGSSTALTAEATASGAGGGFGMVEFNSDIFYYESDTRIQAFDIGGSAIVTNAVTVNNTCPIFVHEGLKKMFYTVTTSAIGATSTSTISSSALITFGDDQRPKMMAALGRFVVVGLNTANNSKTSKLVVWDGASTTIDDLIDIGDTGLQGIANVGGIIYILCSSNTVGSGKFNVIRLYRWTGGTVELVKEIDLRATVANLVTINPATIVANRDTLFFGINAPTADSMNIDNGIWAYNHKTGILTLDRITSDTIDINVTSANFIDGYPVMTWYDGTNYFINHVAASNAKSALGFYESNAIPLNNGLPGTLKKIYINHKPIPTSCGFTVAIKYYGHYPFDGTVPSEDSYSDIVGPQGSGSTTGKTQSTNNATYTEVAIINPEKARYAQIKISFDEISGLNAASIVFPLLVEVEV